jgi:hypothetical protein
MSFVLAEGIINMADGYSEWNELRVTVKSMTAVDILYHFLRIHLPVGLTLNGSPVQ